jgi:hypothetical protein
LVYLAGAVKKKGKARIHPDLMAEVVKYHGHLGICDQFRYRVKNISEGIAFGSYELIAQLQEELKRKRIRPRSFFGRDATCSWSFSTRVYQS